MRQSSMQQSPDWIIDAAHLLTEEQSARPPQCHHSGGSEVLVHSFSPPAQIRKSPLDLIPLWGFCFFSIENERSSDIIKNHYKQLIQTFWWIVIIVTYKQIFTNVSIYIHVGKTQQKCQKTKKQIKHRYLLDHFVILTEEHILLQGKKLSNYIIIAFLLQAIAEIV